MRPIVANEATARIDDQDIEHTAANVDTLTRLLGAPPLAVIARLPTASVTAAARAIESSALLQHLLAHG